MGKDVLKKEKGTVLLINKLGKFERLDQQVEKILVNQVVPGLAPVRVQIDGPRCRLVVDVTGWTPLSVYLSSTIDDRTALLFLWRTITIAQSCERFGLRSEDLCWDPCRIYVDRSGNVVMIYWPITTLERRSIGALSFYHAFCGILRQTGIDRSLLVKYERYFYQRDHFDLPCFFRMLEEIVERWSQMCTDRKQRVHQKREKEASIAQKAGRRARVTGVWLEDLDQGRKHPLSTKQLRVGRGEDANDLVLTGHRSVSFRHAVITFEDGCFFITDMGSKNGCYVRGVRITPYRPVLLRDGDPVRIGDVRFLFRQTDLKHTISIHQVKEKQ